MSLFKNLKSDDLEQTQDRLGGFQVWESNIYSGTVKMAYASQSEGGANAVNFIFDFGGREYRETFWITNKKGENYFLNKQDPKKKVPLPGFTMVEDICLVTTDKPLAEQDFEDKMVNIYDYDLKKEVPKSVPVAVDLIGQPVSAAIVKNLENKTVKNSSGEYVPTEETRNTNTVEKVFHSETRMTVAELRDGREQAGFWDQWVEHNKGKERDRRTLKNGAGTAGKPGAPSRAASATPPQASAGQQPRKSLFDKK